MNDLIDKSLASHKKQREWLICVDSDGCAMDTMDIKHHRCFGPCMIKEWGLEEWQEPVLRLWCKINLYTMTRGINRFRGLVQALCEVDAGYTPIEGIYELLEWVSEAKELSNMAIENKIAELNSKGENAEIYIKALNWSIATNNAIDELTDEEKLPFDGVGDALKDLHEFADVAIVSSANLGAVLDEWQRCGLLDYTDTVASQNDGSKAYCIGELLKHGYELNRVIMCGDAPGDLEAARANGVLFFPILVGKERESWSELATEGRRRLLYGEYRGKYQEELIRRFNENLGGK